MGRDKAAEEGWISVSDRLPSNTDDVLIYIDVDQGFCVIDFYEDNNWYCSSVNITHWMPLPNQPCN